MYKKIMLSLLLLPCMVVSNSDKDCQIEQLKQAQRDKEKEIALIVKTIDEKESLIDSIVVKINNILRNFDSDDREDIQEEMDFFEYNLQQVLMHEKSIKSLLKNDFVNVNNKSEFELDRIKYLIVRYTLEYINLKNDIEQYKKCLQELLELNYQLKKLQN